MRQFPTMNTVPVALSASNLLTTAEVCEHFQIHRTTVNRWMAAGFLRPVKKIDGQNGTRLFARSDVERAAVAAMRRRKAAS